MGFMEVNIPDRVAHPVMTRIPPGLRSKTLLPKLLPSQGYHSVPGICERTPPTERFSDLNGRFILSVRVPLFRLQDEWCRGPGDASLTWLLLMRLEPLSRAAATCGFPCIIDRASSQFSKGQEVSAVTPVRAPPTLDPASYLLHAVLFRSVPFCHRSWRKWGLVRLA